MNISMDGLRLNLTSSLTDLIDYINDNTKNGRVVVDDELKEKINLVTQGVNYTLCVYDDDDKDDFNELSSHSLDYYDIAENY